MLKIEFSKSKHSLDAECPVSVWSVGLDPMAAGPAGKCLRPSGVLLEPTSLP